MKDVGFCKHCSQFSWQENMYDEDLCLECAADRASQLESLAAWGMPKEE